MRKNKLLLLLALLMTAVTGAWAQTVIGNGWSDDFEGATCKWDLINGSAANKWTLGTATNNGGTQAIYISNDGGTTNTYVSGTGCGSTVYAAKLFTFANDEYTFSYDWKANAENNYDYLRVALVPSSVTLTAKATSTDHKSTLPTGWIALDGGSQLKKGTDWQNKSVTIDVSAGDYYLVFEWINDESTSCDPPAAIDNVSITPSSASSAPVLFNLTFNAANANTIESGKATVTVDGTAATVTDGKLENVPMGSEVKMTAKPGYKFRKVEAKKGGGEPEYYDQLSAGYNVTINVINSYVWSHNIFGQVGFTSGISSSIWNAMTITKEQAIALAEYKGSTSLVLYDKGEGSDDGYGGKNVLYKFAKSDGTTVDIERHVNIKNNPSILEGYTVYYIPKNAD